MKATRSRGKAIQSVREWKDDWQYNRDSEAHLSTMLENGNTSELKDDMQYTIAAHQEAYLSTMLGNRMKLTG
jgi:hypothetical protein